VPPQIQELLQNRRLMIAIGIGLALIVVLGIVFSVMAGGGGKQADAGSTKVSEPQREIAMVTDIGKAIEIQALLAREGIRTDRRAADGGKAGILLSPDATLNDRDRALIALVQSGLMDKNVGLEAFDHSDITASREEKRIKLIRALQGELARLIRKIEPIEDAEVTLSFPETTLFKNNQAPKSASIQVVLPRNNKLERSKIRAIINLAVGTVEGLDAQHVSLSDTWGNVYASVMDGGSEIEARIEEQDQYMKDKLTNQLDRLVGPGNYVVTVSTLLRESDREMMVQQYDPTQSAVSSKQTFNESMGAGGSGMSAGGPMSSNLPAGMGATLSGGGTSKTYNRDGTEVSYANAQTQWVERFTPGMLEDISVAVTIDENHFPAMSVTELQSLLAHTANPKVRAESVSIAKANLQLPPALSSLDKPKPVAVQDWSWLFWAGGSIAVVVVLLVGLSMLNQGNAKEKEAIATAQRELQVLKDMSMTQQNQLEAAQAQSRQLMAAIDETRAMQQSPQLGQSALGDLEQTLAELRQTIQAEGSGSPGAVRAGPDPGVPLRQWLESAP
jgi:flagellar M-ring protein FliF